MLGPMRARFGWNVVLGALAVLSLLLLWKLLGFTGVTAVLPLFGGWVKSVGLPPVIGHVVAVLLMLLVVGAVGWGLRAFMRSKHGYIPILSPALSAEEQLRAFLGSEDLKRERVVLVDSPNAEVRTLGIITRRTTDATSGREMAIVYLLTSPNPTAGAIRVIDAEKITVTNLTIADAFRICFSRGTAAPEHVEFISSGDDVQS